MKKIDCGSLNEKQLNRLLKEIRKSDLDIIEIQALKVQKEISVILEFRNENERIYWDRQSSKLVEDLNRLRGSLCK